MQILQRVLLLGAGVAVVVYGAQELLAEKAKLAFTPPAGDWRVTSSFNYPVVAGLENKKLNARITISFSDYELYDIKVDHGFLRGLLEKNEKNTFKPTKPNYERIKLDDERFACGKAAFLEFRTTDELGLHHTIVYAVHNGTKVYFVSAECLEREWTQVSADVRDLMNSIRFTP